MLIPADFIFPLGKLRPQMFPESDLTVNVAAWLERAEIEAANVGPAWHDEAIKAYVYWRAYSAIVDWQAMRPAHVTADGGTYSRTFTIEQLAYFRQQADLYEEQFLTFLGRGRAQRTTFTPIHREW